MTSDASSANNADLPSVIVVMGVSGSGKSTIASMLAHRLGWDFQDGDWFHPRENIEKMQSGIPLTDEERWPWLEAIAAWIDKMRETKQRGVVACSALKRSYRDVLVGKRADVRVVYLKGAPELIARRMAVRTGHFMPAGLLESQFRTLEEPGPEENPITVSIEPFPSAIVAAIVAQLNASAQNACPRETA
jgi:gluconokinase